MMDKLLIYKLNLIKRFNYKIKIIYINSLIEKEKILRRSLLWIFQILIYEGQKIKTI